ncbi:hypothetical protein PMAYCL1PPCAC_22052, partial [Pristionchus mayeri]
LQCHDLLEKKETFEKWIWSDESIVQIGANQRLITTINQFDKRRLQGVRKYPRKVMIWAAITWEGPGPIAFLEKGETLDAPGYIGILEDFLLPFIDAWKGRNHRDEVIFQQDGASCHTVRATMGKLASWQSGESTLHLGHQSAPTAIPLIMYGRISSTGFGRIGNRRLRRTFKKQHCSIGRTF